MIKILKSTITTGISLGILLSTAACRVQGDPAPTPDSDSTVAQAGGEPAVVPVGKGSYAAFPPAATEKLTKPILSREIFVTHEDCPIPTNQWWTDLIMERYSGQLWAFPHQITADKDGVNLTYPNRWNDSGSDPVSEFPLALQGQDFHPADARAAEWGDWTLTFRMAETPQKYMDVTLGRGMPFVWLEYSGVKPIIKAGRDATFFDGKGVPIALPMTGDSFGLQYGNRSYGVFAPDGTKFSAADGQIAVEFLGAKGFLVVCPLPKASDLETFHQFAFAVPRGSRMDWTYSPDRAEVQTYWHITTELLKGTEHRLIQGWLPHHWRTAVNDLKLNGMQYLTPRGTMKCAVGTDFTMSFPFHGIPPMWPAPQKIGLPNDYDPARMKDYLQRYATRVGYGDDTYWGGKSVQQLAQYTLMAHELGDPSVEKLRALTRTALTDWFTYTPGEKAHFFARYPRWRALIGFNSSYGSENFNDNHFHYGYFTGAAALLGMVDPQFLQDYGPMARLVAKQYANWDRADTNFPFLRTFDVWEGHSWASGLSSGTGDNQESSSEAVQSWSNLFLLGEAMGDKAMAAAGAMGYSIESQAALEYWANIHGDNMSPNWKHPIVGMVWSGGNLYGTYFSGDPAWIYGIQWLPASPGMAYLVQDPEFAKRQFQTMLTLRREHEKTAEISSMGTGLGNVMLSHAAQFDPDWAAAQIDDLWAKNDPVAHDNDTPGLTYYETHSLRAAGQIQWDTWMSLPLSRVWYNPRTKAYRYVAFNPGGAAVKAVVYKAGKAIGELLVPAGGMVDVGRVGAMSSSSLHQ